jgi:hypothetical protein
MDRLLKRLVTRAMRRGLAGEPVWLVVGVVAWLVRRARARGPAVVWSGRLEPGERLLLSSRGPDAEPGPAPAEG